MSWREREAFTQIKIQRKGEGKRKERSRIRANSKFVAVTRSVCAPFKFKLEKRDTQIVPFIKK